MPLHRLHLYVALFVSFTSVAQGLSGDELLGKAIEYHDPMGIWPTFTGKMQITMSTPDGKDRVSDITMDLPQQYFQVIAKKDGVTLSQTVNKGDCELALNGNTEISETDRKKHRISCERAHMYKDYYTYLYGLPMKLKDPGTLIDPKTEKRTFKGKTYLVLKATYEKEVGEDTWYFYFDPDTYAMEVYQFYHDESKNDGEYILLTGEEEVSGIKMPKIRAWYYNKDDKYLGTDRLH